MIGRMAGAAALTAALVAGTAAPGLAEAPHGWEQSAMRVPAAQRVAQGKGVTVAVLDTGVMRSHPEFKGRVSGGPDFIGGGARPGKSYWGEHGTAMASSVLRVAPGSRVLSVRVIWDREDPARKRAEAAVKAGRAGADKESERAGSALAKGIRYAVDHGARVVSMSLGTAEWGWGGYEEDTAAAVDYAVGKGVVLVASAGNGGSDDPLEVDANNTMSYPAGYPGVIAVAAMAPEGIRAKFSQVHTYNTIAAPGVDIYAARNTGGYESGDGTSPACALVAGTAALMLSANPRLTPRQVRDLLVRTAQRPPAGYTAYLGFGLVDAGAAVRAASSAAPVKTTAVPYEGKKYFGNGPVGAPIAHPPIDQTEILVGGGAVGVGLLCVAGAFFLFRRPRPRGARAAGQPVSLSGLNRSA
ncbi:S8 family serine peptidase [Nonomuraea sp. 3-1Str]|uniref:S8 family peptidase n=1 Tax=Nonomuraea sp. 3-1Str TaxID=2929801 RepID=UPI002862314C|nr:S8 family serine peptidase [Nonomuraea sp. 3-1Str]MDR8412160.1 S8 family serine peptidase [Nonomuraea sp. 3-1Str]